MRTAKRLVVLTAAFVVAWVAPATAQELTLDVPRVVLAGIEFEAAAVPGEGESLVAAELTLRVGAQTYTGSPAGDAGSVSFPGLVVESSGPVQVELLSAGQVVARASTRAVPGWISIIPPVLAIAVALLSHQVIPALFVGLWVGAVAVIGFGPWAMFKGLLDTYQVYVLGAVTDPNQASILLFSFMIGGMVGIVIKNGGMQGVVNIIVQWATSPRRGQLTTATLGVVIFFDDYANTLVVGNTMRQVTDRLRISREKLAYIVDSTAAPVSCVALVTTWIGYEVGLIGSAIQQTGLDESAYSVFLNSIPYSFYPFLTIFFVFTLANTGRDFGPMHAAEVRARSTGQVLGPGAAVDPAAGGESPELKPHEDKPVRALNAVVPILVLIVSVVVGLYVTGLEVTGPDGSLRDIVGAADSYKALMWASLLGVITAVVMTAAQGILSAGEIVDAWYAGIKSMFFAMIILVLAWSLAEVARQLHTADFLVSVLSEALVPGVVPALVFVLASATAFATGSSWATMGILMPLVVPLVWAVLSMGGAVESLHVLYSTVACVLAGAVLGDHCSPISDTTILSSMASGCDHVEHVRTQLPYAFTVGTVAVLIGTLPTGFGFPWWLSMGIGAGLLLVIVRYVGKPVEDPAGP